MSKGQSAEARQIVLALIENAERAGSPPGYQAGLWHLLGVAQHRLGSYDEAKAALNRGSQALNQGQQTAPELRIALLVELADVNLNQGDLGEANAVLRRALGFASKELPSRHPRLASVHHSRGILFWMQGQLSHAEKALRQSLTILEESRGHDHPDTAVVEGGLARLLTMTGRQAQAIPLIERSKTTLERIYGPLHPDKIVATCALGAAWRSPHRPGAS